MSAHQARSVRFDGTFRQADFNRDLGIGLTLGHQGQNLLLPVGDKVDVTRDSAICRLETIECFSKRIRLVAAAPANATPKAASVPPTHQAFIVVDFTAAKITPPHLASPHEISNLGIKPAKTLVDQFDPLIPEGLGEFRIAVPYDTVRCIDHGDWQVSQLEAFAARSIHDVGTGKLRCCHTVLIRLSVMALQALPLFQRSREMGDYS